MMHTQQVEKKSGRVSIRLCLTSCLRASFGLHVVL